MSMKLESKLGGFMSIKIKLVRELLSVRIVGDPGCKGKRPQSRRLTASLFINAHEILEGKGTYCMLLIEEGTFAAVEDVLKQRIGMANQEGSWKELPSAFSACRASLSLNFVVGIVQPLNQCGPLSFIGVGIVPLSVKVSFSLIFFRAIKHDAGRGFACRHDSALNILVLGRRVCACVHCIQSL
eukprot:1140320-Pelagomonas_calceolata.AAC.8